MIGAVFNASTATTSTVTAGTMALDATANSSARRFG